MGVRPPSNDSDEPDAIEFGIAAVDARLSERDLGFPTTAEEIVSALDDDRVPYDAHGRSVAISTALEETDSAEFESKQDLLNELHPVFEKYRTSRSLGLLQRVRAMLPF